MKLYSWWVPAYLRFLLKGNGRYFEIFTHLTKYELILLYKLCLDLDENANIVEIGSYIGASSSFLACAAKERNHRLYCVDTWTNVGMSEGYRDTFKEFCDNTKALNEVIVPLKGKSSEIGDYFEKDIDLLFVDGDHSYEGVRADVFAWVPKVKNGGWVVFHDIAWAEGVIKVVYEQIKPFQIVGYSMENIFWAKIRKFNE